MKPDPAIFQLLCSRYGLAPRHVRLRGRQRRQLRGRRAAGMDAFRYTGDIAELEAFLGGLG